MPERPYGGIRHYEQQDVERLKFVPEDLTGKGGLLKQLTKQLVEQELQTEMVEHLGYAKKNI